MIKISCIKSALNDANIKYKFYGNDNLVFNTYSLPNNIKNNSIIWIKDNSKIPNHDFKSYDNVLVVTSSIDNLEVDNGNFLIADNSKELFFYIINKFFAEKDQKNYIGNSSTVEARQIGKDVYIGHNCYIGQKVLIGDNVVIKNNVVIEGNVKIGDNSIISSGVVIGSDGYGYYKNEKGQNIKVPHLGGVIIGKNVEVGSNTCIDRGTLGDTIIEDNVKIDNLCHVAHNVHIEKNANVIALSMIAGSVVLKENSYIAPSASVMNQLTIGKNSIVGLGAVVVKNVEDNVVVAGVPAKVIRKLGGE